MNSMGFGTTPEVPDRIATLEFRTWLENIFSHVLSQCVGTAQNLHREKEK